MDEKTNACENHTGDIGPVGVAERRERGKPPARCEKPPAGQERTLSDEEAHKVRLVEEACQARDRAALAQLAVSKHGLVLDRLRKIAWPLLLGCGDSGCSGGGKERGLAWRALPRHDDEDQVKLDVNRSFIYYPSDRSPKEIERRKAELSDLIVAVLRRYPFLCYFQGYHDICQVLLLVLGAEDSCLAVSHLSLLRIRDFMLPSLSPALSHLRLLPPILSAVNPELCNHLSQTQPFFALAATLTLYAHDIQEYGDIARLFDVLLARETVFSVYLFAVIVLRRKEELFDIPPDEPEMLHSVLSKLPKPLDLESLISETISLFALHPPESISEWRSISASSVLKTSRYPAQCADQTLEDGIGYYKKQVTELRRAEVRKNVVTAMWRYRRPAGAAGIAILGVVLAWWIRRNTGVGGGIMTGAFFRRIWQ
ncbi:hypothetical protein GP486_002152 [Trichoglossum hirsutum]|uniref:Rab-GAP TBC domain-containing protein n=1 Tax=Trichoglossum hirsutum TaxID=265104 RepID=A0A9P8LET3_9PEZI|nr:hypothetical protein GP486_002152 [Trichoglossum hirsutum]